MRRISSGASTTSAALSCICPSVSADMGVPIGRRVVEAHRHWFEGLPRGRARVEQSKLLQRVWQTDFSQHGAPTEEVGPQLERRSRRHNALKGRRIVFHQEMAQNNLPILQPLSPMPRRKHKATQHRLSLAVTRTHRPPRLSPSWRPPPPRASHPPLRQTETHCWSIIRTQHPHPRPLQRVYATSGCAYEPPPWCSDEGSRHITPHNQVNTNPNTAKGGRTHGSTTP